MISQQDYYRIVMMLDKIEYALSNKDQNEEEMVSAFICYVELFHLFNEFG